MLSKTGAPSLGRVRIECIPNSCPLRSAMSILLWAYREGDANMRSAWICTCNDVLEISPCLQQQPEHLAPGRVGRILRSSLIMASLALQGAFTVLRRSSAELRTRPA